MRKYLKGCGLAKRFKNFLFPVRNSPNTRDIPRSYEYTNDHVTSVRNNSSIPYSFHCLVPSLFVLSLSIDSLASYTSAEVRWNLPHWSTCHCFEAGLLCPSTVYTANTLFRSLVGLVVSILSANTRGHVLSSNDRNRNYAGPPPSRGSRYRRNRWPEWTSCLLWSRFKCLSVLAFVPIGSLTDCCHRTRFRVQRLPIDSLSSRYIFIACTNSSTFDTALTLLVSLFPFHPEIRIAQKVGRHVHRLNSQIDKHNPGDVALKRWQTGIRVIVFNSGKSHILSYLPKFPRNETF